MADLTRDFLHLHLADELEKLSDQVRAFGRYDNDLSRKAGLAQIQARCTKIETMGVRIKIEPVFMAPYKQP